ncbi:MAG: hypothetical protein WCT04_21665 [Planctomycetota bacterium]
MNLERMYGEWAALRGSPVQAHAIIADAATQVMSVSDDQMRWLMVSLSDDKRKFFTAAILTAAAAVPEKLYQPMLRAAIYETSPLRAQAFVEPLTKAFTVRQVYQHLLEFVQNGNDFEKAGAVNALHWIGERKTASEKENSKPDMSLMSLDEVKRKVYLNTFISNANLDVRRSIITYVDLDAFTAAPTIKELIDKVVKLCRQHPDEYIKHRVEVQLGRANSAYSLPARQPIDATESTKRSWWQQLWK